MAKKYKMLNYGKKYKQAFIDMLQDTTISIRIPDEVTVLGRDRWRGDTNLTYVDFNKVEIIPPETCQDCTNLTQAVFSTHTTSIGNYAFYNCTKLIESELPHSLTYIGDYAFYEVGSSYSTTANTFTFIDDEGVQTNIRQGAFSHSHISTVRGYFNNVGSSAFGLCYSLQTVDVEIHGPVEGQAFGQLANITDFRINPNSVITSLANQVFYMLANNTYTTANIAPFDFRNSTFTSLQSSVWQYCKFNGIIYLPSTLKNISGNPFDNTTGNWKLYFNSIPTVSSSSYLRNDSANFTIKYIFPYEMLGQASVATNWSSHTSQMIGYGSGFEAGTTLPEYVRSSGVAITWYSDDTLTTVVTTSSGVTDVYYCIVGTTRAVYFVDQPGLNAASVTISDGTNTYVTGDPIPVGTSITVTPSPTDQDKQTLYLLRVNGTDYTASGTATVTMNQDLSVKCMYYDGVNIPFLPTLADNNWDMIKLASQMGAVPNTWVAGDTKTLTYGGDTYTARLVDTTGKFTRTADNSTAYLYFELVELLPQEVAYNSVEMNAPATSSLLIDMNSGSIWNNFDLNLRTILEDVNVKVMSQGEGGSLVELPFKLFMAREHDLYSSRVNSSVAEWNAITQDEYYQIHDTNSDRCKHAWGSSSSGDQHWQLSPYAGVNRWGCVIDTDGHSGAHMITYAGDRVAIRFAL